MKKVLGTICILIAVLCWGYPDQVQALDFGSQITIFDQHAANPGDSTWGGIEEDQEAEWGHSQIWDLEGMFLNKAKLTMVGGWNFKAGYSTITSGDIFIDTDGNAVFGDSATLIKTSNEYYKYNYVLDMNWAGGTYDVYQIGDDAVLAKVIYQVNRGSNPFTYESGGTFVTSGSFTFLDKLTDGDIGFLGDAESPVRPKSHYAVTVDLSFLGATERNFLAHFSQACGNDNLVGKGTIVPIPGAILLLAAGLTRLLAHVRRRQN